METGFTYIKCHIVSAVRIVLFICCESNGHTISCVRAQAKHNVVYQHIRWRKLRTAFWWNRKRKIWKDPCLSYRHLQTRGISLSPENNSSFVTVHVTHAIFNSFASSLVTFLVCRVTYKIMLAFLCELQKMGWRPMFQNFLFYNLVTKFFPYM